MLDLIKRSEYVFLLIYHIPIYQSSPQYLNPIDEAINFPRSGQDLTDERKIKQ